MTDKEISKFVNIDNAYLKHKTDIGHRLIKRLTKLELTHFLSWSRSWSCTNIGAWIARIKIALDDK